MNLPFNGRNRVTQEWKGAAHYGLDIVGDDDRKVLCVMVGTVAISTIITNKNDRTWEWGNFVRVDGDDGNRYFYCHLASRAVTAGMRVKQGEVIGIMGNTGKSFGAHLHLQIRTKNNVELNVADVIGVPNKLGTYSQAQSQKPTLPPLKAPSYRLTVSTGDTKKIDTLVSELQLPTTIEYAYTITASSGDYVRLKALADSMNVSCVAKEA